MTMRLPSFSLRRALPILPLLLGLLLCACDGPKEPLKKMATAMKERQATAFLDQIDMPSYAASEVRELKADNGFVGMIDNLGKSLGFGKQLDDTLRSAIDLEGRISREFESAVSEGSLEGQCIRSRDPGCPWIPEALSEAKITKLDEVSSVAEVRTPAGPFWISLHKGERGWLVVGKSIVPERAESFAKNPGIPSE